MSSCDQKNIIQEFYCRSIALKIFRMTEIDVNRLVEKQLKYNWTYKFPGFWGYINQRRHNFFASIAVRPSCDRIVVSHLCFWWVGTRWFSLIGFIVQRCRRKWIIHVLQRIRTKLFNFLAYLISSTWTYLYRNFDLPVIVDERQVMIQNAFLTRWVLTSQLRWIFYR